jgi:hemerythrin-like domain-containing protein
VSGEQPDRRVFDRRTLLVGGLGVLAGGGATAAARALTSGGSLVGPSVASPGEELMTEHGVLKRVLLAYRAASDQLAAGVTPPASAVLDAAQIVADYIESFHEGLEEAYVFPRVQSHYSSLVTTLLVQHDRGRHLTAQILTIASAGFAEASARATLRTDLDLFVRMYEPHEAWEDTVIYPALRALTPQRTLDDLAERFADLETKQYGPGALTQMLDRISGVEEQLGISDLAGFTPPAAFA